MPYALTTYTIDELAAEKKALVRSFFYGDCWLCMTPTIEYEWQAISDPVKRKSHASWNGVLFGTVPFYENDQDSIADERSKYFASIHPKQKDCRILAEAEILGIGTLLSYDFDFVRRLNEHTKVRVCKPSEHWRELGIPPGSQPCLVPVPSNPLSQQTWWRV